MSTRRLRGLIAATATPVTPELEPDVSRLVAHCRALLDGGCHGINLLGTTGEATSLSVAQRLAVMRAVVDAGLPLERFMVGTGAAAFADTVALTRAASQLGYAGALLLPPFYYPGVDGAALAAWVEALVDAVSDERLRIYLYHIPQNTKLPWPVETVAALRRRHGARIVGLKDSAGDLAYARAVAAAVPDFDVFPSAEGSIAHAAADGYAGCISATLNLTAGWARQAWDGWGSAAAERALAVAGEQRRLLGLRPLVASVKAALAARHDDPAWARMLPPLQPLDGPQQAALHAELDAAEGPPVH
jgi:4-hydroxy-tetrahydrodipicolinate synthase